MEDIIQEYVNILEKEGKSKDWIIGNFQTLLTFSLRGDLEETKEILINKVKNKD